MTPLERNTREHILQMQYEIAKCELDLQCLKEEQCPSDHSQKLQAFAIRRMELTIAEKQYNLEYLMKKIINQQ